MGRYQKSNGKCKNHPDRQAKENRNICQECYNKYMNDYYYKNYSKKEKKETKEIHYVGEINVYPKDYLGR